MRGRRNYNMTCSGCLLFFVLIGLGFYVISEHQSFYGGISIMALGVIAPMWIGRQSKNHDWRSDPMTAKQARYIENLGGDPCRVKTKGEASDYIDQLQ